MRATEMLVNFVSLFSQCESPEEFYCYLVELSMISSIALATQETKNSWFVVVILAGIQSRVVSLFTRNGRV